MGGCDRRTSRALPRSAFAMQSGEVNSVITGWETLGASNYKDFESGEWLILSQWVDEPLTDLPQKKCRRSTSSPQ
jgi:hypothetical protein